MVKILQKKNNYEAFLGSLIKKGNKVAAQRILTTALLTLAKEKKVTPAVIFSQVFKKLESYVEIKKVSWGSGRKKRINLIPFPVNVKRQQFLKIKRIIDSAKEDTRKVPFSEKLYSELNNILYNSKKSKALLKQKEMHRLVLENKSNLHYRW